MTRRISLVFLFAALAATTVVAQTHTLNLKLNYEGSGAVNADHRLWVFVFDTPNFNQPGAMPIGVANTDSNGGVVTISGLTAPEVYVAAMYDEKGDYLAMGPPSTGTPVGVLADADGPTPIALDGDTEAEITFDDSVRMP